MKSQLQLEDQDKPGGRGQKLVGQMAGKGIGVRQLADSMWRGYPVGYRGKEGKN